MYYTINTKINQVIYIYTDRSHTKREILFSQRTKGTATLFYNEQVFLEPAIARHLHQDEIMSLPKIAPAQLHITPPTQPPVNPAATCPTQPPVNPAATSPTQSPTNPAATCPTQPPAKPAATCPTQPPAKPAATCPTQSPTNPVATCPTHPPVNLNITTQKAVDLTPQPLATDSTQRAVDDHFTKPLATHLAQKPNDHFPMPSANFSICQSSSPITQQPDKPNTSSQESDLTPTFSDDDFTTVR